jgi:hypothetical protein
LTQETDFFSDHTFPISAVEAEIDEEHFIGFDTTDTSDSEDEYQDFQGAVQTHKEENNTTALSLNSEHKKEISFTILDHKSSTSLISSTPGLTDTELPPWTSMNEGSVSNNSKPSIKYPVSAVVADTDEQLEAPVHQFLQIDSIVAGAFQQNWQDLQVSDQQEEENISNESSTDTSVGGENPDSSFLSEAPQVYPPLVQADLSLSGFLQKGESEPETLVSENLIFNSTQELEEDSNEKIVQQVTTNSPSEIQDSASVLNQEEEFLLSTAKSPDSVTESLYIDSTTKHILQNADSIFNNSDPNQPWSESATTQASKPMSETPESDLVVTDSSNNLQTEPVTSESQIVQSDISAQNIEASPTVELSSQSVHDVVQVDTPSLSISVPSSVAVPSQPASVISSVPSLSTGSTIIRLFNLVFNFKHFPIGNIRFI